MDQERFEALASVYGSDRARWPAGERRDAEAFAAREPQLAARIMGQEAALDDALDQWRIAAPSHSLRARVVAGAPTRRARAALRWLWLTGAGLAAAGASGAIFGAVLFSTVAPDMRADTLIVAAAPDDASGTSWLAEGSS